MKQTVWIGDSKQEIECHLDGSTLTLFKGETHRPYQWFQKGAVFFIRDARTIHKAHVITTHQQETKVWMDGRIYDLQFINPKEFSAQENQNQTSSNGALKAVMPGKVQRISVEVGQEVQEGDSLLVLEAMKMENDIKSKGQGVVKEIHVSPGDIVEGGALLMSFES